MDSVQLTAALNSLEIGSIRYFDRIDSTNAEAARWIEAGCPNLALVVADEQTAGRGRAGRQWFTPPGAALAFSLVLLADQQIPGVTRFITPDWLPRITALGALAVCQALESLYGLPVQIKWPNDVLYSGQKLCGVLAEAHWQGDRLLAIILGIGVNVKPASVPADQDLQFPATCVEAALEDCCQPAQPANRLELLQAVMEKLTSWRTRIADPEFIRAWENLLAFRDQWVRISQTGIQAGAPPGPVMEGQVLGLENNGKLRLRDRTGQVFTLQSGELNLRPL